MNLGDDEGRRLKWVVLLQTKKRGENITTGGFLKLQECFKIQPRKRNAGGIWLCNGRIKKFRKVKGWRFRDGDLEG